MADLVEAARLMVKLEDARNAARTLYAERYEERIEPWRVFIRKVCTAWQCKPLEVGPRLVRESSMPDNPIEVLCLLAATVDVVEEGSARDA